MFSFEPGITRGPGARNSPGPRAARAGETFSQRRNIRLSFQTTRISGRLDDRWGWTRRRVDQFIGGATLRRDLGNNCYQDQLPKNEGHALQAGVAKITKTAT
jgi:hypothetical protein